MERIPCPGRHRGAEFVPVRFVFSNKVTRHDKLLLAFDAVVISKVLCREITHGRIVYGYDHTVLNVKVLALKNEVEKLIDRIGGLISSVSSPDLVLNRHCAECEFQKRCRQKAIDKDDLSLLGSMTEKERTGFNSKGIFTVSRPVMMRSSLGRRDEEATTTA